MTRAAMTRETRADVESCARRHVARLGSPLARPIRQTLRVLLSEVDRLRALPAIDRCSLCSWAHCDAPTDGVCTHPDMHPRCAPIDPTKPPIDACPLRGAR